MANTTTVYKCVVISVVSSVLIMILSLLMVTGLVMSEKLDYENVRMAAFACIFIGGLVGGVISSIGSSGKKILMSMSSGLFYFLCLSLLSFLLSLEPLNVVSVGIVVAIILISSLMGCVLGAAFRGKKKRRIK